MPRIIRQQITTIQIVSIELTWAAEQPSPDVDRSEKSIPLPEGEIIDAAPMAEDGAHATPPPDDETPGKPDPLPEPHLPATGG